MTKTKGPKIVKDEPLAGSLESLRRDLATARSQSLSCNSLGRIEQGLQLLHLRLAILEVLAGERK